MPEKDKGTKKTLTDELLEDNFFKPPIEDVLEEPVSEEVKTPTPHAHETEEEKSDLLFEDFLKSPTDISQEPLSEQTKETASLSTSEPLKVEPVKPQTPQIMVATDTYTSGNKLKIIIGTLGGIVVILIAGFVYFYIHYSTLKPQQVVVAGAQRVELQYPNEESSKPAPIEQKSSEQQAQPQPQPQQPPSTVVNKTAEQAKPIQPINNQPIAENIPPVSSSQPSTQITKQYEVVLEGIKSKLALDNAKHIGKTINDSLKFDVAENRKSTTVYTLYVDKLYSSEGEAEADNLKLMVVNISNASVVKEDGGYRILIGKYNSKAKAMAKINGLKSAGLDGLIKETQNTILTYDLKVYPFTSTKEAEVYQSKVRRLALKVTFSEVK